MPQIKIRRWSKSDFKTVRKILADTWLDTYSFIPEEDILFYLDKFYSEEKLAILFIDPYSQCFISEFDEIPAAWMKLYDNKSQERLYVSSLYVLPQFQGFGIGKLLISNAAEVAKQKSYDRIWLGVMKDNNKALVWYNKIGFNFIEEEPFQMGKTVVTHLIGYKLI